MGLFDGFKKKAEEAKQATVAKAEEAKKDIDTLAKEVVDGRWGSTDQEIKQKLEAAGYDTYLQVNRRTRQGSYPGQVGQWSGKKRQTDSCRL